MQLSDKDFTVTQQDIDAGVRGEICDCPVAKALNRAIWPFESYLVSVNMTVYFRHSDQIHYFKHDEATAQFIKDFDAGRPVTPFSSKMTVI